MSQHCTVENPQGRFCDAPAFEGMPFPICKKHAMRLAAAMWSQARRELAVGRVKDDETRQELEQIDIRSAARRAEERAKTASEVVYYVALGKHIKIGYTTNIEIRMRAYVTGDLLVTEAGGRSLELKRHREFAEYLDVGHEWFLRGPRLIAHIDTLTEAGSTCT